MTNRTRTQHDAADAPTLVLVAHGTRNPRGVELIAQLADAVSAKRVGKTRVDAERVGAERAGETRVAETLVGRTRVAFVDVLGPSPSEVLRELREPAVVVPAFLAPGYHVHTDVPREVVDSEHSCVSVTRALGPDPVLAAVLLERLSAAGWRSGDGIVFAAAGSSDARALREHRRAAAMLAELTRTRVRIGYVATATPSVPDAVADARADGCERVFVASYLLAPGLFHTRLSDAGADGVADPLGLHPAIADLVVARFAEGVRSLDMGQLTGAGRLLG